MMDIRRGFKSWNRWDDARRRFYAFRVYSDKDDWKNTVR